MLSSSINEAKPAFETMNVILVSKKQSRDGNGRRPERREKGQLFLYSHVVQMSSSPGAVRIYLDRLSVVSAILNVRQLLSSLNESY